MARTPNPRDAIVSHWQSAHSWSIARWKFLLWYLLGGDSGSKSLLHHRKHFWASSCSRLASTDVCKRRHSRDDNPALPKPEPEQGLGLKARGTRILARADFMLQFLHFVCLQRIDIALTLCDATTRAACCWGADRVAEFRDILS